MILKVIAWITLVACLVPFLNVFNPSFDARKVRSSLLSFIVHLVLVVPLAGHALGWW